MAEDIVFIVQNKDKEQGRTADVKLFTDVTTDINHQFQNDITEFAVERGADINDNVRVRNNKFTVSGVVADNVLKIYQDNAVNYEGLESRRQQMYNQLLNLRNNKLKFTLVTGLDSYDNCLLKSFSVPVAANNASLFTFSMEVVQIREVFTSTTDIVQVNVREDKKDDAATTSNDGNNPVKETGFFEDLYVVGVDALEAILKDSLVEDEDTEGN